MTTKMKLPTAFQIQDLTKLSNDTQTQSPTHAAMPYDPTLPLPNSPLESQVIRDQLQALFNLINAISAINAAQVDDTSTLPPGSPATASVSVQSNTLHFSFGTPQGLEGPMGQPGPPFAQAVVDGVTTLNPWEAATVGVSFDGSHVRFQFGIPRGNDGSSGPQGNNGSDGNTGAQGPQGPPFALAVVDGVTTLEPGQPAMVQTSFDGSNVRFSFGIPRGADGSDGSQGPPGEVSESMLSSAISSAIGGTSASTNSISTLDNGFSDPPTLADLEALRQKVNELIMNGRR